MVDATLFESLEAIARHVRRCDEPFGGIQLVLTGDFHQLPPVAKGRDATAGITSENLHMCHVPSSAILVENLLYP